MSFKQYNLDNPEEKRQYKREKDHKKFVRENPNVNTESKFINTETLEVSEKEIGTNVIGKVVKIDQLRIRKYPEGEVIKLINRGDEVRIISDFDDIWYKIELNDGTRGYCMKAYLLTFIDAPELDDKSRRCKTNV